MQISVRLFAGAREAAGTSVLSLDVPVDATVSVAARELIIAYPELARWASISRWALDLDYISNDAPLSAGQELAMLPPVSGGGA